MLVAAACLGGVSLAQTTPPAGPALSVYKTPTCGCCSKWVDHMKKAGFQVSVTDMPKASLDNVKLKHKVPEAAHSCHTAVVEGYAIEGHVPATEVQRLLKDKQVTEDEVRRAEDEIQKLTDKAIKDVDDVVKAKEQELMAV